MTLIPALFLASTALPAASIAWENPCRDQSSSLPYCDRALSARDRSRDLVSRLRKHEKLGLLRTGTDGVPRLGIREYQWWNEALHGVAIAPGVNFSEPTPTSTTFPQVLTLSASWNRTLYSAVGRAIGIEGRAFANVGHSGFTFWTPNINLFRDPRWGRGQETPGEDPFLTSQYAESFVRAFQSDNPNSTYLRAAATCKHFDAYSMEEANNVTRFAFDARVSAQDLADTYLPAFEACVANAKAAGIMCSFNSINGIPSCANTLLLTGYLREKWRFDGFVVSDFGAVENVRKSHNYTSSKADTLNATFSAGMDIDCGEYADPSSLAQAISLGVLSLETVDRALERLITAQMRLGMFDEPNDQPYGTLGVKNIDTSAHRRLALEAAEQGIVLLKNKFSTASTRGKVLESSSFRTVLPLKRSSPSNSWGNMCLFGPHLNSSQALLANYHGNPPYIVSPLEGIETYYGKVKSWPGCMDGVYCQDDTGFSEALEGLRYGDCRSAILFLGLNLSVEAEGLDRVNISLPGYQERLALELGEVASQAGVDLILVIIAGGGVDLSFAKHSKNIPAILWAGYGGQSGGQAIADIILGEKSPSGRLPQTLYTANYATQVRMTDMRMRSNPNGSYPGRTYRFYTGNAVVYPFGFGLTYSEYQCMYTGQHPVALSYQSLVGNLSRNLLPSLAPVLLEVQVEIENVGRFDGATSVILMVHPPREAMDSYAAPLRSLAAFEKVFLQAGQKTTISLPIRLYSIALADSQGLWHPVRGEWTIQTSVLLSSDEGMMEGVDSRPKSDCGKKVITVR